MKNLSETPLHFVSSNANKCRELQSILERPLKRIDLDCEELQTTDLHSLISHKLRQAYSHVKTPVVVEDTSLYFSAWNELPGPWIKWFLKNMGTEGLVSALSRFPDKSAKAVCCMGYTADGESLHFFEGHVSGNICPEQGNNGFGWDVIFKPEGYTQTFGEMTSEQKHELSMRGMAAQKLKEFLLQQLSHS